MQRTPWWVTLSSRDGLQEVASELRTRTRAEAAAAGSRIFLALLAYRDHKGRYPASLAELRAGLGWELPPDPFGGRDFRYRPERTGFRLYSIGDNLHDNDGEDPLTRRKPGTQRRIYRTREQLPDDIVWRMP